MRRRVVAFEVGLAALFFLAATLVFTWPIAAHATNGLADLWDAKFTASVLHWDFHQAFHDLRHLFDANIFYPAHLTLASENLFGISLFAFPLYAVGVSTLATYNFLFLLGMFLSALSLGARPLRNRQPLRLPLRRPRLRVRSLASLADSPHPVPVGSVSRVIGPVLLKSLDEVGGATGALRAVFRLERRDQRPLRDLFGASACPVLAYEGVARTRSEINRRIAGSILAAALAGLVVLPLYLPYVAASKLYGMQHGESEITFFSGRPIDFLTAGWQNKLYGPLTQTWGHPEGDFFPGLVALGLGVAALALLRRAPSPGRRRPDAGRARLARALDLVAAGGFVVWLLVTIRSRDAIGPVHVRDPGRLIVLLTLVLLVRLLLAFPAWSRFADLGDFLRRMRLETRAGLFLLVTLGGLLIALGMHTPYYRFLVESIGPVFRSIRVPSRGIVLLDLGLAMLASWALSKLPHRRGIVVCAILLTAFEYRAFPVRVDAVEQSPPLVDRWLATVRRAGPWSTGPF